MHATPFELPANLPEPVDDGAAAHLEGMTVPPLSLPSTSGRAINLAALQGRWVIYQIARKALSFTSGMDSADGVAVLYCQL